MPVAEKEYTIKLTDDQVQFYKDEGYLIVPDILGPEEIERYKDRARAIALGDYPPEHKRRVVRDVRVAKGLYTPSDPELGMWKYLNPGKFDPVFAEYAKTERLLDVVEQLIGHDLMAFLDMFIYKPPGVNAVHHYHQDGLYFTFEPHESVVGTWVPLDDVGADNGTLRVIPRSHKLGYLPHVMPKEELVNRGVFGVEGFDDHPDEVVVEIPAGAGVFFSARTLHKTGGSTSERHRRVLTVHLANAQCRPTGVITPEFEFRLVRGRRYEGCL